MPRIRNGHENIDVDSNEKFPEIHGLEKRIESITPKRVSTLCETRYKNQFCVCWMCNKQQLS